MGVIGGVGGVVQFLPQILILFTFIALLEDCGYMARAAYLMDRVMVRAGLSGRSFIPMLSSFACAVPGIMAARVIENERDRLTTILVAPLLTCSARLPVYALLIAAFVPQTMYLGGTVGLAGAHAGLALRPGNRRRGDRGPGLKRTILRGATPPFVMEMPSYKWPSPRTVVMRVTERAWIFLRTAGSLILAISIVVWAAAYYPHDPRFVQDEVRQKEKLEAQIGSMPERQSAAGGRRSTTDGFGQPDRGHVSAAQPPGDHGQDHRAGRPPLGLGLADRLRGHRLVSRQEKSWWPRWVSSMGWAGKSIRNRKKTAGRWAPVCNKPSGMIPKRPVFTLPVALIADGLFRTLRSARRRWP